MAYNTGNPLGSSDFKDLSDNAVNFDKYSNGPDPTYPNRFGELKLSISGMNEEFINAQEGREAEFQAFLAHSAFTFIGDYAAGLNFTNRSQYMIRDGVAYRLATATAVPYTSTGNWALESSKFSPISSDDILRQDLAEPTGATLVMTSNGQTVEERFAEDLLRQDLAANTGATLVKTSNGQTVEQRFSAVPKTILAYGTPTGTDDTALAQAMITATNSLIVPKGVTLAVKNLTLNDDTLVYCQGVLKLRSGCVDFDKILYAPNKSRLNIYVAELDGNAAGQSGAIGTHLFYGTNNVDSIVNIDYAHHHYYPTTAVIVNTDGIRDTSSGAIFLYRPVRGSTSVKYLYSWGREGVQCREGARHTVHDTKCQGVDGGGEYSGIQVSGTWNQGLNLNVDNAGASGIGWDTAYGVGTNWIVTNTRENHGVNVGHAGFPATGSVLQGIMVDGAYRCGIQISATTLDLAISDVTVRNAGELGISISDSSERLRVSNALLEYAGFGNLSTSATTLKAYNIYNVALDAGGVLLVTPATGSFAAGETVTSGANTGVVRKAIKNRDGTSQTLFLSSKSGTFVAAAAITGGTSGAAGTISAVRIPVAQRAITGGVITVV